MIRLFERGMNISEVREHSLCDTLETLQRCQAGRKAQPPDSWTCDDAESPHVKDKAKNPRRLPRIIRCIAELPARSASHHCV